MCVEKIQGPGDWGGGEIKQGDQGSQGYIYLMKNFPPFYIFTFKKMINFLQENCTLSKIIRLGGMVFGEGGRRIFEENVYYWKSFCNN